MVVNKNMPKWRKKKTMNAITDMVMEGIICRDCGNFIDGGAPGYERNCGCTVEESNVQG